MLRICYHGINIKIAAIQVYHCCEVFVIPEAACPALDVLYNTVDSLKDGICETILKIIEDLLPVVTY